MQRPIATKAIHHWLEVSVEKLEKNTAKVSNLGVTTNKLIKLVFKLYQMLFSGVTTVLHKTSGISIVRLDTESITANRLDPSWTAVSGRSNKTSEKLVSMNLLITIVICKMNWGALSPKAS